jgi:hypothetical protein
MRSTLLIAVLALAPLFAQSPPNAPAARDQRAGAAPPAGTASLKGTVSLLTNGQPAPIRRARMVVQHDAGATETTDTDINGRFLVEHLRAGTYHVVVDKPGFVPIGHVPAVDLKDGQAATVTIAMQRGAAIEGRLLTEDGEPAMGLNVSAVRLGFGPYGKKVVAIRQTTTDDLGRFRLHTLVAGEYYLEAAPDPLRMLNPPPTAGRVPQPARTYYAGTSRLNDARIIAVSAGEELTAIDFGVGGAVLSSVTARVTTSSGRKPASFSVRVQRVGSPPGEVRCWLGSGDPNDNGFQCPSVPPGDFRFLVAARPAPDADVEYGMAQITVDGRDVQNTAIVTAPGAALSGRVEVEGGGTLPVTAQIAALETEYEFPAAAAGASITSATPPLAVAADGTFRFPSLVGSRLLRMTLPDGWALKGVWLDETDVSDSPLSFASGDKPRTVRVVVTPRTGSVGGAVLAAANRSAAGTRVVVFTEDSRRWGARSRFIRTAEVNAAGRYTISGLLPGKYFIAAVDALDDGAWEDPDVLARLQTTAAPIVVTSTERLTLDVRPR